MPISVVLLLAAVALLAGYGIACRIWPYAACRRCEGNGKLRSPSGRAWRICKRCGGTGTRLRTGRKVLNHLSRTLRETR